MKKFLVLFTAALLLCLTLTPTAMAGTLYSFPGGNGDSTGTPYEIHTQADLKGLADDVNGGETYTGKFFKLMNNITLTGEWTPIGTAANPFSGTFDGNNHEISGLDVNNPTLDYQGLFGYVDGGTVENLGVSGTVIGRNYVGGVVGQSDHNSSVTDCYNAGSVEGQDEVGGVVGWSINNSSVTDCYNTGSVEGQNQVGGVVQCYGRECGGRERGAWPLEPGAGGFVHPAEKVTGYKRHKQGNLQNTYFQLHDRNRRKGET